MSFSIAQLFDIMKESPEEISMEESLEHWLERFDGFLIQSVFEAIDKELYTHYYPKGWRIDRKEKRTIQFVFGSVSFTRRRLRKERERSFLPLDRLLGIKKWSRYSQNVKKKMVEVAMESPFRKAAQILRQASRVEVSHTTVHSVTQEIGEKVQDYLQYRPEKQEDKKKPAYLFMEGDGLHVGGRDQSKPIIHRVLIHEGVKNQGSRHRLIQAKHFSSVESSKKAFEKASRYLHNQYNLRQTIVLTNSDGGAGYQKVSFEDAIGHTKRHEHFRDRFHVNKKIKERLSFDKTMQEKIQQGCTRYDWEKIESALATAKSRVIDVPKKVEEERLNHIDLLRAYLKRNWSAIKGIEKRELPNKKGLGVCETSHRTYSYRMKKQGRSWSKKGAKNMAALLTVKKNKEVHQALTAQIDQKVEQLGEHIKGAARQALKQMKTDHLRIQTGKIANVGATSSFIGQMVKTFS